MTKKIKINNGGYEYLVEIYYKNGVEQSEKSAKAGVENIPLVNFEGQFGAVTSAMARSFDNHYKPRPHLYGKRKLVQANDLIPQELWNIEMWNYEEECEESKWQ